jgi:hypothetical protein
MKLITVSDELHREIGAPTDYAQPLITFWLRSNIGELNTRLGTGYSITLTNYEIYPEMGENEKSIFKEMFFIYYYDRLIMGNLGSASFDSVLEVTSDGATVRKVNKNEVAKTYLLLKKDHIEKLEKFIIDYKSIGSAPCQVAGDDTYQEWTNTERQYYNRTS